MTAAELLKPRFEVIADYPHCPFKVGSILSRIEKATNDWFGIDNCVLNTIRLEDIQKYPHIFKPLNWWEHRKVEDMPKNIELRQDGQVFQYDVQKWEYWCTFAIINESQRVGCTMYFIDQNNGYFPID